MPLHVSIARWQIFVLIVAVFQPFLGNIQPGGTLINILKARLTGN